MGKKSGTSRKVGRPRKAPGEKKRRKVTVQFLERVHVGKVTEPYEIMERIVRNERADLKDVKIGIAWRLGWRANADGHLRAGQCKKRGDLDRELDAYDFIILLNKEAWPTLDDKRKERLVFHELEHAQLSLDSSGEPKRNDRGRLVCRIRKHDIEEFRSVIEKYGLTDDLSKLAQQGIADAERPLLAEAERRAAEKHAREKSTKKPHKGICRICGCTDDKPCVVDGVSCHWVEPDLCSVCKANLIAAMPNAPYRSPKQSGQTKQKSKTGNRKSKRSMAATVAATEKEL